MRNLHITKSLFLTIIGTSACVQFDTSEQLAVVPGAIFTTTADGARVNANIYNAKEDVYLDGGPGANAPSGAAGLPEGDYFFQVTSPSGQTLLSSDDILCRRIHVNANGVIDLIYEGPGCQHASGVDQDHPELGAITVQLFPYDDTPNPGGEYKVWLTPFGEYDDESDQFFGFSPSASKTDNYKVIAGPPPPPPPACGDGKLDTGEQCDDGNVADNDGCSASCTIETRPPVCGDAHLDDGEQCDDGNVVDDDGCSANCTIETPPPPPCCGNGVVEVGEDCDDGNTSGGDGCSASCTVEVTCPPKE